MTYSNPWQSYRQVATQTAPPGQLILMLYDGILRFLDQALTGFTLDDPLEFNRTVNNNILRAQDIINELNLCLNMDVGGEYAQTMRGLYMYFDRRLQESNVAKTDDGIRDVIGRVRTLREAWAEMLSKQGQGPEQGAGESRSLEAAV